VAPDEGGFRERWCVQAKGRDQDIRGIKHLDRRLDLVLVTDFEARTQLRRRRAQEDDALVFAGVAAGVRSAAEGEGAYDADGRGERADATDLGGRVDGEGFLSIGMRMGSSARRGRV
jgi:hypothetical protein